MLVPIDSNEKHTLTLPQRDEHRFSNIDEIKNNMYEPLITPLADDQTHQLYLQKGSLVI